MKKMFYILLILGFALASCENDGGANEKKPAPKITLSEQNIEVECEPQEYSISVTSPDYWVASTESEWIIIETDSGMSGTQELKFRVERYEEVECRVGTILVQNEVGTLSAELRVEQKAFVPSKIMLSSNALQYGFDGGVQEVSIACNYDYDIEVDCSWLTYQRVANGISVTVEPSVICEERSTEIVVVNEKYNISASIAVVQAPFVPCLEIEQISALDFDYTGGTKSIAITSNFEYEIVSESDWVIIDKTATGINIVVKALYPVLNVPRSTSFTISDSMYGFEDTVVAVSQQCKESDFAIGDMVEFNGVRGVVFYRDTSTTKIVSVEQGKAGWSTEFVSTYATDYNNGMNNMSVIQSIDSWETKYPAFAWCANLGESWYLPARAELYAIWEKMAVLNEALVANGYTAIGVDQNYYYWSSTQSDKSNAYKLYFTTGVWDHYYKYSEYFVRAVYAF